MGNVAWKEILVAGWPVLSVLFIASIVMFGIILDRYKTFARINIDTNQFLNSFRGANEFQKVLSWCETSDQPVATITKSILKTKGNRDDKERIMQRSIQYEVMALEKGISVLGTIASVAPFVGLLGTVIGIIRAFQAVSSSTAGGAGAVALGISEALVGTAAGLVVAIPALLAYNFFVNRIRTLTQSWELAGAEIVDISLKNVG